MKARNWFCSVLMTAALMTSAALGSDMDMTLASDAGLRGKVKQCVEQTIYPAEANFGERTITRTSVYSPDGKLLKRQSGEDQWKVIYTYDPGGNLLTRSTTSEGRPSKSTYNYDAKGRLVSVSDDGVLGTSYEYDEHGLVRRVQRLPVLEPTAGAAAARMATQWENSDLIIGHPSGGMISTTYDEHRRPVEATITDATGKVTMRIVRKFDEQGRVLGDKLYPESMDSSMPGEMNAGMSEAQKGALAKFLARALSAESNLKYDEQGRLIEKAVTGGISGNEVTRFRYNDHGDVSQEESTRTLRPEMSEEFRLDEEGGVVPVSKPNGQAPESRTESRYEFEYDSKGNWTRKTLSVRSAPDGEFKVSMTVKRTLTYY